MAPRVRPAYYRDPPLVVFGERVRDLRTARGWSQEQLAARADRHFSYMSAIERGEHNATLLTTLNIAAALAVDPGVLLTTDERAVRRAVRAASKVGSKKTDRAAPGTFRFNVRPKPLPRKRSPR
jgi:transcriptional regulator with XRE-family HTH domain